MKKFLLLSLMTFLIASCGDKGIHDSYSQYRDQTAEQLYNSAIKHLKRNHPDEAIKELEAQSALYPFGAYAEDGLITLVYAYYENDDNDEALATADRYLRLYPRGRYSDYAYYMKGVISENQGLSWAQRKAGVNPATRDLGGLKDSYVAFHQLVTNFPESSYASDALTRMRYVRNLFAEKTLNNAKFYYDRQAYVAAANRASDVIVHFEGSPAVIPALAVMIRSYRQLGLDTQANRTVAILRASYPNSPECAELCRAS